MAQKTYIGASNVAKEMSKGYIGINNVAKEMSKIYIGDANGKARLCYESISELEVIYAVGTTAYKVPSWANYAVITGCGGGGGGGGCRYASTNERGGGGGGAAVNNETYDVSAYKGQTITITVGAGGAVATHHGDGAGAQAQAGVPVGNGERQNAAEHVLHHHHQNGNAQENEHLFTALFQQTEAGGVAHAGEEQGHKKVLHVIVEGELENASRIEGQVDQSEDQTAYHGGGDAAALEKFDPVGQKTAQNEQKHGDSGCLEHVEGERRHKSYSFFLLKFLKLSACERDRND